MDAKCAVWSFKSVISFNPRARDGREMRQKTTIDQVNVSIHAPVMDANTQALMAKPTTQCFNPRARDGRELTLLT